MAKGPSPARDFFQQIRKAVTSFFGAAVGSAATAVGAAQAAGNISSLDPFAVATAAVGVGLVAALAVYKTSNRTVAAPEVKSETVPIVKAGADSASSFSTASFDLTKAPSR